jgi:diketogulonate reductase-like aldo/keto reductase
MLRHLHELMEVARHLPAVNQIELSPYNYLQRKDVIDFCKANSIAIEAYSPLTKGRKLDDPRLVKIARHHKRTPAQVLIRYCIQKDTIVLPKSNRPERIRENAEVFDWNLSLEDVGYLDSFNENLATGWDPTHAE